jgi:hypothetical protein
LSQQIRVEELAQEKAKELFDRFGDYAKAERFGYCLCSSYTRINTRISGLFNLTHQIIDAKSIFQEFVSISRRFLKKNK